MKRIATIVAACCFVLCTQVGAETRELYKALKPDFIEKLNKKSFNWTKFLSIPKDAKYQPWFSQEILTPVQFDRLPNDLELVRRLVYNNRISRYWPFRVVETDAEAIKRFYAYSGNKDYEGQKNYLLKNRKRFSRVALVKSSIRFEGKNALLILVDLQFQAVAITVYVDGTIPE